MSQQQRDNSGILGKNNRKEKDSHPTHSGQCMIDGKQYWISAWVKDGRDGSRFFSLAFKPKMAREHAGGSQNPPAQKAAAPSEDFDDSIPFAWAALIPFAGLLIHVIHTAQTML